MRIRPGHSIVRSAVTAAVVAVTGLAVGGVADAAAKTIYFRDGLGASARVTYKLNGKSVGLAGRLWDKKGDGYHARIYGVTNGRKFGIRKVGAGRSRAFRGASPVPTHFEDCTYDRNVPLRCTTRWTPR
jgi:hypothetical protein